MSEKLQKYDDQRLETVQDRPWVAPLVDIFENDSEVLLVADLPGVTRDSLKIHLDKDQLMIEGRVDERSMGTAIGCEYQSVDYRRSFLVPRGIDGNKIAADLKHGVLSLHLPKAEALRPRQIAVKAG